MFGYSVVRPARFRRFRAAAVSSLVASGLLLVTPASFATGPSPAETLQLPTAPAAPQVSQFDAFERTAFTLVNAERAKAGLPALVEVPALDQVSTSWSTTLAGRGRYGSNAVNPAFAGQISTAGVAATSTAQSQAKWYPHTVAPETIHGQLMANATISANIRSSSYRYVGLGLSQSDDGTTSLVLTFANTAGSAPVVDPVAAASPVGSVTSAVRIDDAVTLTGTAQDPDATTAVTVTVRDSGTGRTWTGSGPEFSVTASALEPGSHELCVTAGNQNVGKDTALGCVSATVPDPVPTGSVTVTGVGRASVSISGRINAVPAVATTAAAEFRSVGGSGGMLIGSTTRLGSISADGTGQFTAQFTVPDGQGEICLTASRPSQGSTDLACVPVNVPSRIIGNHDKLVVSTGQLVISGWAHDTMSPTTSLTGSVAVTDSQGVRTLPFTADIRRADVARVYPAAGELHGLSVTAPVRGTGQVTACLTVNSVQAGVRPFTFPCKTITV